VAHDPVQGPHVVEDIALSHGGGFTARSSHRTNIALPPAVAQKMSTDQTFADAILDYCADRRQVLEKVTVVYDPSKELGVERLFPKWMYAKRDGGHSREAIDCALPPKELLELACASPKTFATADVWRSWCSALPSTNAAEVRTDSVPPRIAALVLADPQYFTTPEYRTWIGKAKQLKREEIISRELIQLYHGALAATGVSPI